MMERLREGANSLVVKIILSLIILSFVFAGVGSYLAGGGQMVAATVNGEEIDVREFEQQVQQERNRMQQQGGEQFLNLMGDPAYVAQFRQMILNQMINDVLIQQHADQLGLRVSDAQVRQEIFAIPAFQVDGRFDNDLYNTTLRRMGLTPDGFAERMRSDMRRQQLLAALAGSEFTLDSELAGVSALESQTRMVRTVTLSLDDIASDVTVEQSEVQAYYDMNSTLFTRPDQVKASYIELSAALLADQLEVSAEDVQAYYDANIARYSSTEKRRVSHILIEGDSSEAQAQAVLDRLNAGEAFADLAKALSADTFSGENGGDLDWIEKGAMDPAFEDAAFALASVGDVSEVVQSDFGFHIIKLTDLDGAVATPLAEVEAQIRTTLQQDLAVNSFFELKDTLADVAFEKSDNLDDAAEATGTTVQTTDFISETDAPGVLADPRVIQALFSQDVREDGFNSEVIELDSERAIVVRVDDFRYEEVLPFEDVEADVLETLTQQKAQEEASRLAEEMLAALEAGETVDAEFGDAEAFTRRGPNWVVANAVFGLPKPTEGPVYGSATGFGGDVIVFSVESVQEGQVADDLRPFGQQMLQGLSQQSLESVMDSLLSNAKVTSNVN
ncbi:peptidylprolyl isomerase [Thaumasiovibrio subtropicus]|uniref:peptidylprolyl isomerase n=1 Tax=Thaumasiovibrio subtropicus TaxID=1891207 RepID=UPI000B361C61|nr:peptidylprolyl isomerase [Thaumasiovibrio subtropicus]